MARQIGHWNVRTVAACLVGAAAAWWITIATPTETPDTWWFIMLSGAIAICAMILPGISGAFILLLLGKYQFIMQAVGDLNIPVIVIFVVGAVAGIISFSHLLSWLLKHWHDVTVAVLMGFMVGSLNKVWPLKEVVETYTDSHGKIMPLVESNVAPGRFEALTQQVDAHHHVDAAQTQILDDLHPLKGIHLVVHILDLDPLLGEVIGEILGHLFGQGGHLSLIHI